MSIRPVGPLKGVQYSVPGRIRAASAGNQGDSHPGAPVGAQYRALKVAASALIVPCGVIFGAENLRRDFFFAAGSRSFLGMFMVH